jgi:hypothetical protein
MLHPVRHEFLLTFTIRVSRHGQMVEQRHPTTPIEPRHLKIYCTGKSVGAHVQQQRHSTPDLDPLNFAL